jgi:hypothetical protein
MCMNGHRRNLGLFSGSSTQGPVEVVTDGYSFTTSTGSSKDIRRSGPRDLGGYFFCSDLKDWCSKDYICLATYNVDYVYIIYIYMIIFVYMFYRFIHTYNMYVYTYSYV